MMSQPNFAQDPDELFDVVNEDGTPTGKVKRRADVHREGDWHRAIHVWVYGVDADGPFVLFNQRGLQKDTWAGYLDVTVGGHLSAGENVDQAFREIEEEIGIVADASRLDFLVTRKAIGEVERELQEVFLYRDDRALTDYQPNPAELEGLVRMPLAGTIAVFSGGVESVEAVILGAVDGEVRPFLVTHDVLLSPRYHGYYLRVARAVERAIREDCRETRSAAGETG
jgi:isopentenyldiphosphate isomerase